MGKVSAWARRCAVVFVVAVLGMTGLASSAGAVETGWSWFPPGTYAKFNQTETSAIVQAGVGGAAAYVSAKLPTPPLKAAAAVLGVSLWLSAKTALESADQKCMIIMVTVWRQASFPAEC